MRNFQLRWPSAGEWLAGGLLVGLLLLSVPLMLCMPLTADPILYDLQARVMLEGGVLYRDIVEPNLPGIVWLHAGIRTLFGWSETALKVVDLFILGGVVLLLVSWVKPLGKCAQKATLVAPMLLATTLLWCYFGTSEWCHCQRDSWMFLPALAGLWLRRNQLLRIRDPHVSATAVAWWGVAEGLVWACGFWIKPFIAVPALAIICVGLWLNRTQWRRSVIDLLSIVAGGTLIGAAGTIWLIQSGTWPHFWEMAIEWNPTYFEVGRERWTWDRLWRQQMRFMPFSLCHLFAIPWSIWMLQRVLRRGLCDRRSLQRSLLPALYLGWLTQTFWLQHLFDYIHVPELLLAIAITVENFPRWLAMMSRSTIQLRRRQRAQLMGGISLAGLLLMAAIINPATSARRVAVWPDCLTVGSTPEVKTALQHFPLPHWTQLEPAIEFLREKNLADGQLTVHNVYLVHAYRALELKPSTRYVYLDVLSRVFRSRQGDIEASLDQSGHRYVLSSLLENGLTYEQCQQYRPGDQHQLPPAFPAEHLGEFPYNQSVVFRSGQYIVHEVDGSVAPINPQFSPLAGLAQ